MSYATYFPTISNSIISAEARIAETNPHGYCPSLQGKYLFEHARLVPRELLIVELGSYMGLSTAWLGFGSRNGHGASVVSVDLHDSAYATKKGAKAGESLVGNMRSMGLQDVTLIKGRTTDVASRFPAYVSEFGLNTSKVGMLYVDANHTYEDVLLDFSAWREWLTTEAFVVFDDYTEDYPGVIEAVDELVGSEVIAVGRKIGHAYFSELKWQR